MTRGDIWWVDLGEPRGSAPAFRRPVVIVSDDRYNASALRTVSAVVLTRTQRLAALPGNVALPADVTALPEDSVANVTQLVTLDREALEDRVSALPAWVMAQIDHGLRQALGLR